MMSGPEVLEILDALAGEGIAPWVDGGWGVDALPGEQTREHEDLDLVIALDDGGDAERALSALGFAMSEDERPTRFVLAHDDGRRIDFHTVVFDEEGGGVQRLPDGRSYRYPPEGFAGEGVIGGRAVRCLTPEVQLECHLGYEPDKTDRHGMWLLAERFGLRLPKAYRR
jgi:lincosamide nucleotidyltransferase A/C/D/E